MGAEAGGGGGGGGRQGGVGGGDIQGGQAGSAAGENSVTGGVWDRADIMTSRYWAIF